MLELLSVVVNVAMVIGVSSQSYFVVSRTSSVFFYSALPRCCCEYGLLSLWVFDSFFIRVLSLFSCR